MPTVTLRHGSRSGPGRVFGTSYEASIMTKRDYRLGHGSSDDPSLSQMDLRSILDEAGICTWVLDIPTGRVAVSPTCTALFGVPAEELVSLAAIKVLVHPEDREARSVAHPNRAGARWDLRG